MLHLLSVLSQQNPFRSQKPDSFSVFNFFKGKAVTDVVSVVITLHVHENTRTDLSVKISVFEFHRIFYVGVFKV